MSQDKNLCSFTSQFLDLVPDFPNKDRERSHLHAAQDVPLAVGGSVTRSYPRSWTKRQKTRVCTQVSTLPLTAGAVLSWLTFLPHELTPCEVAEGQGPHSPLVIIKQDRPP